MANHKSAEKRNTQSKKLQELNRWWKSRVKTAVKAVLGSVETKNATEGETNLRQAMKEIHKAAGKGVIHKNTAARKISRLAKKLSTKA